MGVIGMWIKTLLYFFLGTTLHFIPTNNWRASKASKTLSGVYKFELVRYMYIYIYMYGGTCAIIVAHATYM